MSNTQVRGIFGKKKETLVIKYAELNINIFEKLNDFLNDFWYSRNCPLLCGSDGNSFMIYVLDRAVSSSQVF